MEIREGVHCIVCSQQKVEGQGIHINNEWICMGCESEMVKTDVQDPKYPFFIHQLKRIWYQRDA